jgi:DNA-binding IclR family transcriptional regulator
MTILTMIGSKPTSVAELSVALDVHPTTALRLVQSLRKSHFVQLLDDGRYSLGPALISLGHQALESSDLRTLARPFLSELNAATTETVHMAALMGTDILYVDKVAAQHAVRIESRVGHVVLKHCTGVGKAILSCLSEVELEAQYKTIDFRRFTPTTITTREALDRELELTRERGYSIDDEEHEAEICCVAVPVWSAGGEVMGSISVSAPESRMSLPRLLEYLPDIQKAASGVSSRLGYRKAS